MTLHLPKPYPDELVGSMLQRGRRILGLERTVFFSRLTGHPGLRTHSQLLTKYEQLAHTYGLSFNEFVRLHTVLPYSIAFLKEEQRQRLLAHLLQVRGNYEPLAARAVIGEQWFKRCPECVAAELRQYGESYWHRVHQLSAVYICVHHRVQLEWTSQSLASGVDLLPPHESVSQPQPQGCDVPPDLAWALATTSANILWGDVSADAFPPWKGSIESLALLGKFEQVYGSSFLKRYGGCLTTPVASVWPLKYLNVSLNDTAVLQRILLQILQKNEGLDPVSLETPRKGTVTGARAWRELEDKAIADLEAEVERSAGQGRPIRLMDLYAIAGLEFLKHGKKYQMPRLMAWIEDFKKSSQSARMPGGRRKNELM